MALEALQTPFDSQRLSCHDKHSSAPAVQGATDSSGHSIDREFYRTFWGLQAVFQKPYSIIEPSAWAAATSSIHRVLAEFRKQVQRPFCALLSFVHSRRRTPT